MFIATLAVGLSISCIAGNEGYLLDCEVWLNGQRQDDTVLVVGKDGIAAIEFSDADSAWRLELEVEETLPGEQAPDGAFWVHVKIHEQVDGAWEHLTDTLLGVVSDRPAALGIVSGKGEGPEQARLYVAMRGSRLKGQVPAGRYN